ncbi:unnamed protein product [Rhizoctonia solani]|uniref:DUF6535 domain-containing protein n=1 Tax=Rhizoctonia solani TaxID=456999 RepID=A0A8H3D1S9_9AGAM|nr:unnamed protein product [Rhizoctonia solani]
MNAVFPSGLGRSALRPTRIIRKQLDGNVMSAGHPIPKVGTAEYASQQPQSQHRPQQAHTSSAQDLGIKDRPRDDRPRGDGSSEDFGMEGAELSKEATIWKSYVKEADEYDKELVEGWNNSLEVILVFAALFSAVATAFILESSKKLEPDPSLASVNTLLAISQNLLAITSNVQVEGLETPAGSNQKAAFVPPRTVVIVNTLWYASLALSIATSFIAMLAKEWCHSFLAGRTGDTFSQAQRRQQKWTMIKRWKMQELLMVLPSLIHLSLLFFAAGLCIDVWELNTIVAIPIICISALAVLFYVWSSIAATLVDFYPYTTIISNILRSTFTKASFRLFVIWFWPVPLLCLALDLIWKTTLELVYNSMRLLLKFPRVLCCCNPRLFGNEPIVWWKLTGLPKQITFPITMFILRSIKPRRLNYNHQKDITILALQWLIENCETPASVEVALQAIAGASQNHPREPLLQCEAALMINQKLALSNILGSEMSELEDRRYTRALNFLESDGPSGSEFQPDRSLSGNELQVTIGRLQSSNELYISGLLSERKFPANDLNLAALRLGSIAASHCLKVARRNAPRPLDEPTLQLITQITQATTKFRRELHPAAAVSLFNAVALLSASSNGFPRTEVEVIINLCLQLLRNMRRGNDPSAILKNTPFHAILSVVGLASEPLPLWVQIPPLLCVLCLDRHEGRPEERIAQTLSVGRLLSDAPSMTEIDTYSLLWVGVTEVLSHREPRRVDRSFSGRNEGPADVINLTGFEETDMTDLTRLQATKEVYRVTQTVKPSISNYLFLVRSACNPEGQLLDHEVGVLLSRFCFPVLSADLIDALTEHNLVARLRTTIGAGDISNANSFIAATQLWILYVLLGDVNRFREQEQLRSMLGRADERGIGRQHLERMILERRLKVPGEGNHLEIYSSRIVECILQTGHYEAERYKGLKSRTMDGLKDVSPRIRGLSHFSPPNTGKLTQIPTRPPKPPHVAMTVKPPPQAKPRPAVGVGPSRPSRPGQFRRV